MTNALSYYENQYFTDKKFDNIGPRLESLSLSSALNLI